MDWERWDQATQGVVSLHQRTKAGVAHRKAQHVVYRANRKKLIHTDCAARDGPAFDMKQCQNCHVHIPSRSAVCPGCKVPATQLGALAAHQHTLSLPDHSVSKAQATAALTEAMLATDASRVKERTYLVGTIRDVRKSTGGSSEYLVQWAGWPHMKYWDWRPIASLQDANGAWTCQHAMDEFSVQIKSKK